MQIELTNGAWARLKAAEEVTEGEMDDLAGAYERAAGSDFEKALEGKRSLYALLVEEWSFPIALPREDPAAFRSLKRVDTKLIEAAVLKIQDELVGGVDFGANPDLTSPT